MVTYKLIRKAQMRGRLEMMPWVGYFAFVTIAKPGSGSWMYPAAGSVVCVALLVSHWYYSRHPLVPPMPPSSTTI